MSVIFANAVQQRLIDMHGTNISAGAIYPAGYIEALMSPFNKSSPLSTRLIKNNGKKRTIENIYFKRAPITEILTAIPTTCGGNQPDTFSVIVDCNNEVAIKRDIDRETLQKIEEADEAFINEFIASHFSVIKQHINTVALADQVLPANLGVYQDNTSVKSFPLINGTAQLDVGQENKMLREISKIGYGEMPLVIGHNEIYDYYAGVARFGSPSGSSGFDSSIAGKAHFFPDIAVNTAFAATNHGIILVPRAVQYVDYNAQTGAYARQYDDGSETSIVDPSTGIQYDFTLHYDKCAKKWSWVISTCFGFARIPKGIFPVGDPLPPDVNGVLHFTT
jgi:hypothetical protein